METGLNERLPLLALPPEILEEVWRLLDLKALKSMRQTSKVGEKLSSSKLFRHFKLYPHMKSFERLHQISQCPQVACHIQAITYDTAFLSVTDMIVRRLRSGYRAEISEEQRESMIEGAMLLNDQSIRVDIPMDNMAQMGYLHETLPRFPQLKSFIVREACSSPKHDYIGRWQPSLQCEVPHFYQQLVEEACGRYQDDRLDRGMCGAPPCRLSYGQAILLSLHSMGRPLEKFELSGFGWRSLLDHGNFSNHSVLLQTALSNLRTMKLIRPAANHFPSRRAMHNLHNLLKRLERLEELHIAFHSCSISDLNGRQRLVDLETGVRCESYFEAPPGLERFQSPARLTWSSQIKELRLEGLVCTAGEMRSILRHCSPTLTRFRLERLILMPETTDGPRACLVGLLKWMQRHLQLSSFQARGYFTNGGMQSWMIRNNPGVDVLASQLRLQVEQFVVNGGHCPLDDCAIPSGHYDLHKPSYDPQVPKILQNIAFGGDASWEMLYRVEYGGTDDVDAGWEDSLELPFGYDGEA